MNDNAQKLATALRSDEFKQTRGALRDESGYCCLGVACELYRRAVGGEWTNNGFVVPDARHSEHFNLPDAVRYWLGFKDHAGGYGTEDEDEDDALANDNDAGKSFATIADIIEAAPEGLFA